MDQYLDLTISAQIDITKIAKTPLLQCGSTPMNVDRSQICLLSC
jgi:hypothetical protein